MVGFSSIVWHVKPARRADVSVQRTQINAVFVEPH